MMSQPPETFVSGHKERPVQPLLPDTAGLFVAIVDAASVLAAGALAAFIYWSSTDVAVEPSLCGGVSILLAVFFAAFMQSWGLYEARSLLDLERQAKSAGAAWLASLGLVLGLAFLLKASADLSRGAVGLFAAFGLVILAGQRLLWRRALLHALDRGLLRRKRVVVLSSPSYSQIGADLHLLRGAALQILGHHHVPVAADERSGMIARLIADARNDAPDEVLVLASHDRLPLVEEIVAELRSLPMPIKLLPDPTLSRLALHHSCRLGTRALIDMARAPLSTRERVAKRALDIVLATIGLFVAGPLLLVAMAAIRLETPGPVLFRQRRRGFNGRTFRILKLRTMTVMEDGPTVAQATRHDPRVTRVGAWLRRTSVDELPQLWNVLRGEMSIVGPRPHATAHDDHYHRLIQNYAFRQHVKPGITGWAQVNGHRGETPELSGMAARVEHDLWYVSNWSLGVDARIVLLTVTRWPSAKAY